MGAARAWHACEHALLAPIHAAQKKTPLFPLQIDYACVLLMTPSLMLGLALGVVFNAVVSQWLLNLLIIGVWLYSSARLAATYRRTRAREVALLRAEADAAAAVAAAAAEKAAAADDIQVTAVAAAPAPVFACSSSGGAGLWARAATAAASARARLRRWAAAQPWRVICTIAALFLFFVTCQVLIGAVVPGCSPAYWGVFGTLLGVSAAATVPVTLWLLPPRGGGIGGRAAGGGNGSSVVGGDSGGAPTGDDEEAANAATDAPPRPPPPLPLPPRHANEDAVVWSPRRAARVHAQMVLAGLMLGAWPLSPIVFALGLHPQVAAGTSKLLLLMITSGAALAFIAAGRISTSYMLAYGITNALATPAGVWVMDRVIKRTRRPSHITLLTIVRLLACCAIQLAFSAVPRLAELARGELNAHHYGFMRRSLCGGSG